MWTAWRQQRILYIAMLAASVSLITFTLISGFHQQTLWTQFLSPPCNGGAHISTLNETHCGQLRQSVENAGDLNRFVAIAGLILSPLFASILGVSAVAREIELRTTRLSWTQTGSRSKWLASKYAINIAMLFTISVPLSLALAWWNGAAHYSARIGPAGFPIACFLQFPFAVVAFTVVLVIGLLFRRAGWSLAVGIVVAGVLLSGVELGLRPILASPTFTVVSPSEIIEGSSSGFYASGGIPADAWGRGSGYAPIGTASTPSTKTLALSSNKMYGCLNSLRGQKKGGYQYCSKHERLEFVGIYVPGSAFWPLQFEEGAICIGLIFLLGSLSFAQVRRVLA